MTTIRAGPTREQRCALHLLDLCRAYPRHPAQPQALASLEGYRVRGFEVRRQAELKAAQEAQASRASSEARQLVRVRRRLIKLIGERGGLVWRPRSRGALAAEGDALTIWNAAR
jgi:hypothetical protein